MRVFRDGGPPPSTLAPYLTEVFLDHPWREADLASLVHVAPDGVVRGFIGLLPLRLAWRGRSLCGAVASTVMVDGGAGGDPLAGARLVRTFLSGPQDVSLGECAADVTRRMWLPLGARTLALRSLRWMRVLRPAGFVADLAARRVALLAPARLLARPLDRMLARPCDATAEGVAVAPEDLAAIIPDALQGFALRPDFDLPALRWLLAHAMRKERRGTALARVVTARRGRAVGGWLGHLRPGGLLQVQQAFAPPSHADAVLDDILAVARRAGAVAACGPAQPEFLEALQLRGCFLRHGGFSVAHARDPALAEALQAPDAFLGGVAGETWIRLSGSTLV